MKKRFLAVIVVVFIVMLTGCSTKDESTIDQLAPMAFVPEGYFTMGFRIPNWAETSETYKVWLDDYYIDIYEVTNASYKSCVSEGGCNSPMQYDIGQEFSKENYYDNPAYEHYPVININWTEASAYCAWRGARLPTEAEWQKAARGTDFRIYPWGDDEPTCNLANYSSEWEFNPKACSPFPHVAQVGSRPDGVSPYGAYDLAGNVEEWVVDCYLDDPSSYLHNDIRNPVAPENPECSRTSHGGSFFIGQGKFMVIDRRLGNNPELGRSATGFRCAFSP